jgi:hypothetical protein
MSQEKRLPLAILDHVIFNQALFQDLIYGALSLVGKDYFLAFVSKVCTVSSDNLYTSTCPHKVLLHLESHLHLV